MARKGRSSRKGMGKYLRGSIDEGLQLGTLAAEALISNTWDEAVVERTLVSSIVATWSLDGIVAGQGPILFGISHSDYDATEIEEVIENTGSWNEGNKISQEIAKRQVRILGQFVGELDTGTNDVRFNGGKPVKTKLNWILTTGDTLRMWAYNISGAALTTADPEMRAQGHANLWAR